MALKAERVDTWAVALEDTPGSLAAKLDALASAGINLGCIIARRAPDKPGTGVVFVTPIKGAAASRAAGKAGFKKTNRLHTVRVQGPDKAGACQRISHALAQQGLNLRGMSSAALGKQFVTYIAVDTAAQAAKAMRVLRGM